MPIFRLLTGVALVLGAVPACTSGIEDAPRDEACLQARYAVASAQYACGIEPKAANVAYETFGKTYTCVAPSAQSGDFECAERILDTPCAEVLARPADDAAYPMSAAACGRIFRRVDGAPLALSTVPSKNPVCERLAHRFFSPTQACTYAESGNYGYGDDGSEPHDRLRADIFGGRAALDAAFVCLATDPATDVTACLDQIGCQGNTPQAPERLLVEGTPCAALLGPLLTTTGENQ